MIYRAIQLIQIFCAHWRTNERTKVIQEVLTDLKNVKINRWLTNLGFNKLRVREIFNVRRRAALWRQETFPRWLHKTKRRNCTKTKKFVLSRGATTNWVFKFSAIGPTTIQWTPLNWTLVFSWKVSPGIQIGRAPLWVGFKCYNLWDLWVLSWEF